MNDSNKMHDIALKISALGQQPFQGRRRVFAIACTQSENTPDW